MLIYGVILWIGLHSTYESGSIFAVLNYSDPSGSRSGSIPWFVKSDTVKPEAG